MSLIHQKLYQSDNVALINMELYIKELVEYFKFTFDIGSKIKFVTDIEPLQLNSTQAVPLGLIINEAVINSIKHAFPDTQQGTVSILVKEIEDKDVFLTIKDNGVGIPEITATDTLSSLGMKLIRGFGRELNAQIGFSNENGTMVTIQIPKNNRYRSNHWSVVRSIDYLTGL